MFTYLNTIQRKVCMHNTPKVSEVAIKIESYTLIDHNMDIVPTPTFTDHGILTFHTEKYINVSS